MEAWFPNAKGGQTIAETIFGDYNPGRKLLITFPKSLGQIEFNFPYNPGFQSGQSTFDPNGYGKTQVVCALYHFGFGLSYTTFEYSNLSVSPKEQYAQGNIEISVYIKNVGNRKGDKIVQQYIKYKVSSLISYVMQLRGFNRISLEPGETKTVRYNLKPNDLQIFDKNMNWTFEPGEFEVLLVSSSKDIRLKKQFFIIEIIKQ